MPFKQMTKRSLTKEMDRHIKRMLKLVEEDGDSFAKKADMYYQKRPELISHVEEFYRLYRSLAERYDHVTGELRNYKTSELQSMSSCISDGSETPSALSSPDLQSQRLNLSYRKSGTPRAAGFDFFLGSCGNSMDNYQKEEEESISLCDSELESDDDSPVNNYSSNGIDPQRTKIIDLEIELRELKEKLQLQQEDNAGAPLRRSKTENSEKFSNIGDMNSILEKNKLSAKIAEYEQEPTTVNEKLKGSKEQNSLLNSELERYKSLPNGNACEHKGVDRHEGERNMEMIEALKRARLGEVDDHDNKIEVLVEEQRITQDRLHHLQKEIASLRRELESQKASENFYQLQSQLEFANRDIAMWKTKFKTSKVEKDVLTTENATLKSEVSCRDDKINEMETQLQQLQEEQAELVLSSEEASKTTEEMTERTKELEKEIQRQRAMIMERAEEKREAIRQLCFSLEHYRNGYDRLRKACRGVMGPNRLPVFAS